MIEKTLRKQLKFKTNFSNYYIKYLRNFALIVILSKLKIDHEIVLEVDEERGNVLEYASEEIKIKREIVTTENRKNEKIKVNASSQLRNDR